MKKLLLILLTFISLNTFAQMQVKEGSFKHIPNAIMNDKYDHLDGNDLPMALIKISTENIPEQERLRLKFSGNLATQITKTPKTGQMWIYISAENATFINIMHPDYGTCKYHLPEKLCDFCTYEMVLQYVPIVAKEEQLQSQKAHLIIKADQDDAVIYIDDQPISTKETSKLFEVGTTHTWMIKCNMYHTESGTVTLNERTVIDKKLRPNFGYLDISTSPEQGAKVFIDEEYIGLSPIKTDKLKSGTHTVRVIKDMFKMTEKSFNVIDGQISNATLDMFVDYVNVVINSDSLSDIYVDEEFKGIGQWNGRLSDGIHILEARKENHKTSLKRVELNLGETVNICLDNPKPINGMLDITSNPIGGNIYIDGKYYGETPNFISDILVGKHELKIIKQGCAEFRKTIDILEGVILTLKETLQSGKEITITTDMHGDSVYVDGTFIGCSPVVFNFYYGTHEVKAERNGKDLINTITIEEGESNDTINIRFDKNETFIVNGVSFNMIYVDGGTFRMGAQKEFVGGDNYDPEADYDEYPVHNVTLSGYYIGETEVTQELWTAVMGSNPSKNIGNQKPVNGVSWDECQEFVKKLNQLVGKNFRLPTEAEWEYAAKGGDKSKGYKYSGSNDIYKIAQVSSYDKEVYMVKTRMPNELGVYDMCGNVKEWCQDIKRDYSEISQVNPQGAPSFGTSRVIRGGVYKSYSYNHCRSSSRDSQSQGSAWREEGLRLAMSENIFKPDSMQKIINGHECVDLGLSVKWASCNIGANKPEDNGYYFEWGAITTKSSSKIPDNKNVIDISGDKNYDAARVQWGAAWRIPTKEEFIELINRCIWIRTIQNGKKGYMVIGPNGNSIFFPYTGYYSYINNYDLNNDDDVYHWTSTFERWGYSNAEAYNFSYKFGVHYGSDCRYKYPIRPVID